MLGLDGDGEIREAVVDSDGRVQVGTSSIVKEVTLSLDTNAYADGDVLAATQEITSAMRVNGGTGVLQSLVLLDKDDQGGALDVLLMRTTGSIGTENAAAGPTDAVADEILAVVEIAGGDYVDLANSQIAVKDNLGVIVDAASDSQSLFVAAISRDTKTYSAAGITLKLGFLRD
jgi:hypothetical protein